ncbi:unnamed protein product [Lepeophtheirus salmonis]|uniref:(salmon louse) hypothetical protein n=1 Tax=Lepeophtheirus salmonis TaxID=72036 RepID=A0A7R8CV83_LEPSM|nr:unnamed protein product [Lepeophtheirus salmonis]CAF2942805.1 unnamed protein product [Lepeophtheirus salmonis]
MNQSDTSKDSDINSNDGFHCKIFSKKSSKEHTPHGRLRNSSLMDTSKSRSSSTRHSRRLGQGPSSDCSGSSCSTTRLPTSSTLSSRFSSTVPPTEMSKEEWLKEIERREFYKNYNAMDGAITAVVLGGFFAFVCLLVVYKTKCKPMWKNRGKKLTNTPATQSNADIITNDEEDDEEDEDEEERRDQIQRTSILNSPPILSVTPAAEDFGFECIPLRMGGFSSSHDDEGDLYYLDECGNYLFPVPTPNEPDLCSCSQQPSSLPQYHSTLDSTLEPRRNSQVSSVSNAYTVKSLPGAYLYIPVVDPKCIMPLGSVKRSLSDPEIHFASPSLDHLLILTVNPSSEQNAKRGSLGAFPSSAGSLCTRPALIYKEKRKDASNNDHFQFSMNSFNGTIHHHPLPLESVEESAGEIESAASFADRSCSIESYPEEKIGENNEENSDYNKQPSSVKSVSEMSASGQIRGMNYRKSRVSSLQEPSIGLRQRRFRTIRQLTLPANSSSTYLTVPAGRSKNSSSSPSSSSGDKRTNSFCSIVSEDDGDIFDSEGQLKGSSDESPVVFSRRSSIIKRAKHSISEYSDLCGEEFQSDISELFLPSGRVTLAMEEEIDDDDFDARGGGVFGSGGRNDEGGVILSEEGFLPYDSSKNPLERNNQSSSCSGSSLDSETSIHQFTVPVTIEHPPPGLRSSLSSDEESFPQKGASPRPIPQHVFSQREKDNPVGENDLEADLNDQEILEVVVLVEEELQQSLQGIEDESECVGIRRMDAESGDKVKEGEHLQQDDDEEEGDFHMVLVRDIGVQVSGDSPNLSLARSSSSTLILKSPSEKLSSGSSTSSSSSSSSNQQTDTYVEKFPPEILF